MVCSNAINKLYGTDIFALPLCFIFSAAKQALKYIHHLPFKKMWLLGIKRGKYFEKLKEENQDTV